MFWRKKEEHQILFLGLKRVVVFLAVPMSVIRME